MCMFVHIKIRFQRKKKSSLKNIENERGQTKQKKKKTKTTQPRQDCIHSPYEYWWISFFILILFYFIFSWCDCVVVSFFLLLF